jgi:hypothetical protein
MSDLPEKLEAVPLRLDGVVLGGVDRADDFDPFCSQLQTLPFARAVHQYTCRDERDAGTEVRYL